MDALNRAGQQQHVQRKNPKMKNPKMVSKTAMVGEGAERRKPGEEGGRGELYKVSQPLVGFLLTPDHRRAREWLSAAK